MQQDLEASAIDFEGDKEKRALEKIIGGYGILKKDEKFVLL